ncbi:methylated-DNA--[protein]-cysteine S-methyltransferase, partial [Limnobacter sp.]|uniref:methylated-DNA--[protein]-cysteine S-methyltransferase n=1 Tax=Limnobacter sp. TaxID=2003368 RepID=UPI0035189CA8
HFDVSPSHLQRVFSEWAGITPKQFFYALQRDHALALLREGANTLHTSVALGMHSTSQLHHLTLHLEGMTPGEVQQHGRGLKFMVGQSNSPFGNALVCQTHRGIHNLEFQTDCLSFSKWVDHLRQLNPEAEFITNHQQASDLVHSIFLKHPSKPTTLRMHVQGTPFQLQVWEALLHIEPGRLASYQQLAKAIGKPKASRAVGGAIAANPVGVLIPCHRVIQTSGMLGQYRWHPARKAALHIWEAAHYQPNFTRTG